MVSFCDIFRVAESLLKKKYVVTAMQISRPVVRFEKKAGRQPIHLVDQLRLGGIP